MLDELIYFPNKILCTHSNTITSVKFSSDGSLIASACKTMLCAILFVAKTVECCQCVWYWARTAADKTLKVIDTNSRTARYVAAHDKGINDITWMHSDYSQPVLVSSSDDLSIKIHDVALVSYMRTKSFCMS